MPDCRWVRSKRAKVERKSRRMKMVKWRVAITKKDDKKDQLGETSSEHQAGCERKKERGQKSWSVAI